MQIRVATNQDYESICRLFLNKEETFWIYPDGTYPFTRKQLQDLSEVRSGFTVGVEDKDIVGFANIYGIMPRQHLFIGNVVVRNTSRGKGYGRALVAHMLNLAWSQYTIPEVRIAVFSQNIQALLLYTSLGFVPYQVEERTDFEGKRVALLYMRMHRDMGEEMECKGSTPCDSLEL